MRFIIQTSLEIFSRDELEALRHFGRALQRLMNGQRRPETPAQHRFVKVCRGEASPESFYEKLWKKYLDRLAWARDPANRSTMGPRRKAVEGFGGSREDSKKMHRAERADFWKRQRE